MVDTYTPSVRTMSAGTPLASPKPHGPFPRVKERAGESSRVLSETLLPATAYCSLSTVHYTYSSNTFDLASVSCGSHTTLYSWAAGRLTNVSSFAASAPLAVSYSYLVPGPKGTSSRCSAVRLRMKRGECCGPRRSQAARLGVNAGKRRQDSLASGARQG